MSKETIPDVYYCDVCGTRELGLELPNGWTICSFSVVRNIWPFPKEETTYLHTCSHCNPRRFIGHHKLEVIRKAIKKIWSKK